MSIKLNYDEYYKKLPEDLQRIDDHAWLEVMETDPRVPREDVEATRRRLSSKMGRGGG
jgi:hypothetical protein